MASALLLCPLSFSSSSSLKRRNCSSSPSYICNFETFPNRKTHFRGFRCRALQETKDPKTDPSAEDITQKFGLESGLWKIGSFMVWFWRTSDHSDLGSMNFIFYSSIEGIKMVKNLEAW